MGVKIRFCPIVQVCACRRRMVTAYVRSRFLSGSVASGVRSRMERDGGVGEADAGVDVDGVKRKSVAATKSAKTYGNASTGLGRLMPRHVHLRLPVNSAAASPNGKVFINKWHGKRPLHEDSRSEQKRWKRHCISRSRGISYRIHLIRRSDTARMCSPPHHPAPLSGRVPSDVQAPPSCSFFVGSPAISHLITPPSPFPSARTHT